MLNIVGHLFKINNKLSWPQALKDTEGGFSGLEIIL
jgi:hypothetical protein